MTTVKQQHRTRTMTQIKRNTRPPFKLHKGACGSRAVAQDMISRNAYKAKRQDAHLCCTRMPAIAESSRVGRARGVNTISGQ